MDADQLASASGYTPCADPESVVRGGPTLTTFLFVCFLVDEGRESGFKYHFKWNIIGHFADGPMMAQH